MDSERRKAKRLRVGFSVTYSIKSPLEAQRDFGVAEHEGIAEDLSVGGLLLSTNHPLPAGAIVGIKFRAISGQRFTDKEDGSRKFEIQGEARHSRHTEEIYSYVTGIHFGKLTEDERWFLTHI